MKSHCTYTGLVDPASLAPNPRNPNRRPDRQIALLAKMIEHRDRKQTTIWNFDRPRLECSGPFQAAMERQRGL